MKNITLARGILTHMTRIPSSYDFHVVSQQTKNRMLEIATALISV